MMNCKVRADRLLSGLTVDVLFEKLNRDGLRVPMVSTSWFRAALNPVPSSGII